LNLRLPLTPTLSPLALGVRGQLMLVPVDGPRASGEREIAASSFDKGAADPVLSRADNNGVH